jgi:hypothetical protein
MTDTTKTTTWQASVTLPVGFTENGSAIFREATLRKMTGKEEALMADPKHRNNGGKLITALLANCVTELEGVEKVAPAVIRKLTSADRNYLLLELRRLTFGDEMEAHYRCPSCQSMTVVVEDLRTLDIRHCDEDIGMEISVVLEDGYWDPDGNWQHDFVFRLPNGEDEELAGGRRDANPARQRDALLARCLQRVGDLDPRRVQVMGVRVLADLSMSDRRQIQRALDEAAPGPDLTRDVICDHCGEDFRASLDMSHFFPLE